MSENVEVVRRVYADWERGQWAASADLFDPGLEVVFSASAFPDAGTYRGGRETLATTTTNADGTWRMQVKRPQPSTDNAPVELGLHCYPGDGYKDNDFFKVKAPGARMSTQGLFGWGHSVTAPSQTAPDGHRLQHLLGCGFLAPLAPAGA